MTTFYMMIAAGVGALLLIAVMRNRTRAAQSSDRPAQKTDGK